MSLLFKRHKIRLSGLRKLQMAASNANDISNADGFLIHSSERKAFSETAGMECNRE